MDMQTKTEQATGEGTQAVRRWDYGEIADRDAPQWVRDLMADCEAAGFWERGIVDGNRRGSFSALNTDIYGWGEVAGDRLALVQVRQTERRSSSAAYLQVRRDYYLIGRLESGAPFAHPTESPRRSAAAMRTPESAVRWVLARHIWRCDADDLDFIVRQGDIALVPVRRIPADAVAHDGSLTLRDSHQIEADQICRSGRDWYARGVVRMRHTPGEHARVVSRRGLWRIQEGERGATWGFTRPNDD